MNIKLISANHGSEDTNDGGENNADNNNNNNSNDNNDPRLCAGRWM